MAGMVSPYWFWPTLFLSKASTSILAQPQTVAPSSAIHNATTSRNAAPYCDEDIDGQPRLSSCLQALEKIPDIDRVYVFGKRPIKPVYNVPLPYRFISRKNSPGPKLTKPIEFELMTIAFSRWALRNRIWIFQLFR